MYGEVKRVFPNIICDAGCRQVLTAVSASVSVHVLFFWTMTMVKPQISHILHLLCGNLELEGFQSIMHMNVSYR